MMDANNKSTPLIVGIHGAGVQRQYAPTSICFGCGLANEKGLQIDSHRCPEGLELRFTPSDEHQAFPGMVNGGIIAVTRLPW